MRSVQVYSESWLRLCGLSGWCQELRLIKLLGLVTILFVRNCANLHVPCELRQKPLDCADESGGFSPKGTWFLGSYGAARTRLDTRAVAFAKPGL